MLTIVYYYVDEFYQKVSFLVDRPCPQAVFSDSEVITMALVNQMVTNRSGDPVRDSLVQLCQAQLQPFVSPTH